MQNEYNRASRDLKDVIFLVYNKMICLWGWGWWVLKTGDAVTWLIIALRSRLHDYCCSPYVPFIGSQMQQGF